MAETKILRGLEGFKASLALASGLWLLLGCSGTSFCAGPGSAAGTAGTSAAAPAGAAGAATRNVAAPGGRDAAGGSEDSVGSAGAQQLTSSGGASSAGDSPGGAAAISAGGQWTSAAAGICEPAAGTYRVGPCVHEPGELATGCVGETHCLWEGSDTVCGCSACAFVDGYLACPLSLPAGSCDPDVHRVHCVYVERRIQCDCVSRRWRCEVIHCPDVAS